MAHKPKRTKPIRTVSNTRRVVLAEYKKRRKAFLMDREGCVVCCNLPASEIHHTRGRAGSLMLNEKFWLPVCAKCHVFIHNNIGWARKQGYIAPKGQWNNPRILTGEK